MTPNLRTKTHQCLKGSHGGFQEWERNRNDANSDPVSQTFTFLEADLYALRWCELITDPTGLFIHPSLPLRVFNAFSWLQLDRQIMSSVITQTINVLSTIFQYSYRNQSVRFDSESFQKSVKIEHRVQTHRVLRNQTTHTHCLAKKN